MTHAIPDQYTEFLIALHIDTASQRLIDHYRETHSTDALHGLEALALIRYHVTHEPRYFIFRIVVRGGQSVGQVNMRALEKLPVKPAPKVEIKPIAVKPSFAALLTADYVREVKQIEFS